MQPSGVWTNLISASLPLFQDEKLGHWQLPTTTLLHFPYQYVGNCMHISWLAYMQWSYLFPSSQVQLQKSMGRKKAEGRVRKGKLIFFLALLPLPSEHHLFLLVYAPTLDGSFPHTYLSRSHLLKRKSWFTNHTDVYGLLMLQLYLTDSKAYLLAAKCGMILLCWAIPWQAISLLVAGYSLAGFPIVHTTCADGPHKWWSRQ